MVENAAQGREAETHYIALEKEAQKDRARSCFTQMCKRLDTNGNGQISLEEMTSAVDELAEFRDLLLIMDVGPEDIEVVFHILDQDKSGGVGYEEFSDQLWKMKSQ